MTKNGNDNDRDDSLIDSLLARLVMKVIREPPQRNRFLEQPRAR
jgi:hypothetical protein